MSLPSLLGVFAHPDDESLSAGGLLAQHAAAGARTAVVTATWAEGTPRDGELEEALRILGAGKPRLLEYADAHVPHSAPDRTRLCDAPLDDVVRELVGHIREFRPEVVVTHDAHGGLTGHPDHVYTHRVTVLAVQAANWRHLYPETGDPWQPRDIYLATHPDSASRELGAQLMRPGLPSYSVPDEWIAAAIDVSPWLDTKLRAIAAHHTEVARGALPGRLATYPYAEQARLLGTEWFIRYGDTRPGSPRPTL